MEHHVLVMSLIICLSRICDVTLMSVRTILLTKGMPKIAAFLGFFEVMIYISVLGSIVSKLNNPFYLIAYCTGYASGIYIGSKVEAALAFGEAQMRIIVSADHQQMADDLRNMGFGVTTFVGQGRDAQRIMMLINLKRKSIKHVYEYISKNDIKAVVSTNDISSTLGAYEEHNRKRTLYNMVKK